jgi:hypothetical protein
MSVDVLMCTTENGAISLPTTGNAQLDLFFKVNRDTPKEHLFCLLNRSWLASPVDTLRLGFHLRDCRGGKGEKKQFYHFIEWLLLTDHTILEQIMHHIPHYGTYKDLYQLFGTCLEKEMINLFTFRLFWDYEYLSQDILKSSITLAAKYAPTEGGSIDKKHNAVKKFTDALMLSPQQYRQQILVPLRRHLNIVETHLTNSVEDWERINFSHVPSLALKKYKKAFARHQPERYTAWLQSVKSGKSKINTDRLMPHQLVEHYVGTQNPVDETIEVQWRSLSQKLKRSLCRAFGPSIAMVDVSGSMSTSRKPGQTLPINVAISLGILLAEMADGQFRNTFLTFSSSPELVKMKGETLHARVAEMNRASWTQSTNFEAAFNYLLSQACINNTPANLMPTTLFVLSDMQFDLTTDNGTNWDALNKAFAKYGYNRPRIVFWNLNGSTLDFPVSANESNVQLISGFSTDVLKMLLDGDQLSPVNFMRKVIDSERYSRIEIAPNIFSSVTVQQQSSTVRAPQQTFTDFTIRIKTDDEKTP